MNLNLKRNKLIYLLFWYFKITNLMIILTNLSLTSTSTATKGVFPIMWESIPKEKSIKRITECQWEEVINNRSNLKYEFVDFNQINGLFLFDIKKKIFININDKDYSVGKSIDNLITITNGEWTNFNQFSIKVVLVF